MTRERAAGLRRWARAHHDALILGGLAVLAYVAANNRFQAMMPWAIAALLGATVLTGLFWPRWLVRRLSVERSGPDRAVEGERITFEVEVENRGWLPRFMVELVGRLPFLGAAAGEPARGESVLGLVSHVPGRARRRFELPVVCEKRGFYRLEPVGLASSFPLGLFEATRRGTAGVQTLTVYPSVFPIASLPLRGAPSQIHRGGYLLPEGAGAAEFCGLREYRRGDNPRHVHWPTTARRNELMIREFEPLASACLHIVVDLEAAANVGAGRHATLEYALRIAASIARYATQRGLILRMSAEGERPVRVPAGSGERHYRAILDELAVADSDGDTPYAALLEQVAIDCQPGETCVLFFSGPPQRSDALLRALGLLAARRAHLYAVMLMRETFAPAPDGGSPGTSALRGGLLDLGAHCVTVRNGDDLTQVFNP